MGDAGVLQAEPMDRAVRTAAVFAAFLRAAGVNHVDAVATSAIRDASNRDEFLAAVQGRTGLEVRVISGAEEARYGYLAIVNSLTPSDGLGIDVGGGSVQLMRIADRRLEEAESVGLGSVRVSEAFLEGEEAFGKQIKALRKHVGHTLSKLDWWAWTRACARGSSSRPSTITGPRIVAAFRRSHDAIRCSTADRRPDQPGWSMSERHSPPSTSRQISSDVVIATA